MRPDDRTRRAAGAVLVRAADRPGQGDGAAALRAAAGRAAMAGRPVAGAVPRASATARSAAMPLGGQPFSRAARSIWAPTTATRCGCTWSRRATRARCSTIPAMFDFGDGQAARAACRRKPGFAGFRVHYLFELGRGAAGAADLPGRQLFPGGRPQTRASASRRAGLALETGLGRPEEFPAFTHFWILRPQRAARSAADLRAARQPERGRRLPLRRGAARRAPWSRSTPACSSAPTSPRSASRR